MANLWVIGDSYSHINTDDSNHGSTWSAKLADNLGYTLYNDSMWGICQDWEFQKIAEHKSNISSDDQLIVVLTDPARYWFFNELPYLTNVHCNDFEDNVNDLEKTLAVRLFVKYIQRPNIDIQHVGLRLGWLNNLAVINNWKKPIVIAGFSQYIPNLEDYTNLIISVGSLTEHVSNKEINIAHTKNPDEYFKLMKGCDPRFNHMCLQNHNILVEKLLNSIMHGDDLDLTVGFIKDFITMSMLHDESLRSELSEVNYKKHISLQPKINSKESFYHRIWK